MNARARHLLILLAVALGVTGCPKRNSSLTKASSALPEESAPVAAAPEPEPAPAPKAAPAPAPAPAPKPTQVNPHTPSAKISAPAQDDPKISRSPGEPGGVVVLWPRVIPSDITDMNRRLIQDVQTHLRVVTQRTLPGRPLDVRPEPERTCRRSGCEATAVNVLFTRHGDGCAVVAVITPPGPVESTLVPWAGGVELSRTQIPFRDAPESNLRVKDLARCSELLNVMRQNDAGIEAAIRAATPSR